MSKNIERNQKSTHRIILDLHFRNIHPKKPSQNTPMVNMIIASSNVKPHNTEMPIDSKIIKTSKNTLPI